LNLYLASTSPRRRALLRGMGLDYRLLRPADAEAELLRQPALRRSPARFARAAAVAKAESAAARVRSGLVIGVDTVVTIDGLILGKPRDRAEARAMLERLSGRTHRVISGLCVLVRPTDRALSGIETTRVTFRDLSPAEVERYVATPEPYDKAGAYGIQERAGAFVRRVSGCYVNVVGLPVGLMLELLERAGWRPMARA
jgi:septum formation protein